MSTSALVKSPVISPETDEPSCAQLVHAFQQKVSQIKPLNCALPPARIKELRAIAVTVREYLTDQIGSVQKARSIPEKRAAELAKLEKEIEKLLANDNKNEQQWMSLSVGERRVADIRTKLEKEGEDAARRDRLLYAEISSFWQPLSMGLARVAIHALLADAAKAIKPFCLSFDADQVARNLPSVQHAGQRFNSVFNASASGVQNAMSLIALIDQELKD